MIRQLAAYKEDIVNYHVSINNDDSSFFLLLFLFTHFDNIIVFKRRRI